MEPFLYKASQISSHPMTLIIMKKNNHLYTCIKYTFHVAWVSLDLPAASFFFFLCACLMKGSGLWFCTYQESGWELITQNINHIEIMRESCLKKRWAGTISRWRARLIILYFFLTFPCQMSCHWNMKFCYWYYPPESCCLQMYCW